MHLKVHEDSTPKDKQQKKMLFNSLYCTEGKLATDLYICMYVIM